MLRTIFTVYGGTPGVYKIVAERKLSTINRYFASVVNLN
jgi:hypothetical protein